MSRSRLSGVLCLVVVMGCSQVKPGEQQGDSNYCDCIVVDCGESGVREGTDGTFVGTDGETAQIPSGSDAVVETDADLYCAEASDCLAYPWYTLPRATQKIEINFNVDAWDTPPVADWDPSDPGMSSNFSTAITVYDSLNGAHRLDVFLRKSSVDSQRWDYHILVDGGELIDGASGVHREVGAGALYFTLDGYLQSEAVSDSLKISFKGASPKQAIAIDFGDAIIDGGTGWHGSTSFADASMVRSQAQDAHGGSGIWSCVNNRCEPVYGYCPSGFEEPCCGDGTCNAADGKGMSTCKSDCDWACSEDVDCIGRSWETFIKPTTEIELHLNLDAGDMAPTMAWSVSDPGVSSNFSTRVTVYDSEGISHIVLMYFRKSDSANLWTWHALVDGGEITDGTSGINWEFSAGSLQFTPDGYLKQESVEFDSLLHFRNTTQPQSLYIHFNEGPLFGNRGYQTTQYNASSIVRTIQQDGHIGTGHWRCEGYQCVPEYDACDEPATPGCCGDGVCKVALGMDEYSCPSACEARLEDGGN